MIAIAEIQHAVSEHFNVSMRLLLSARRWRAIARPRQVAMYLATELSDQSLPVIGRKFNRDHSTVMHGARVIKALMSSDQHLREKVENVQSALLKNEKHAV